MVHVPTLAILLSVLSTLVKTVDENIPAGVIQIDHFTHDISFGTIFNPSLRSESSQGRIQANADDVPVSFRTRYPMTNQGEFPLAATGYMNPDTGMMEWTNTVGLSPGPGSFSVYNPPNAATTVKQAEIYCQLNGRLQDSSQGVAVTFGTAAEREDCLEKGFDFVRDTCEGVAKNGITVTCIHPAAGEGAGFT